MLNEGKKVLEQSNELVEIRRDHLEELRFYAFAGTCVARFQQFDDHLRDIFAVLMEISVEYAAVTFDAVRSVNRRCEVITKLISIKWPELSIRWQDIVSRSRKAEHNRNDIAHGLPVYNGGLISVRFDKEANTINVVSQGEPFFCLEKPGHEDWTTERLRQETQAIETLLSDLYALERDLKVEPTGLISVDAPD